MFTLLRIMFDEELTRRCNLDGNKPTPLIVYSIIDFYIGILSIIFLLIK